MKVVILAGGLGTRLMEETTVRPKPLVEIGGRPILWHIMQLYASHGFDEFVVAAGYKGEMIESYFGGGGAGPHPGAEGITFGAVGNGADRGWSVRVVDTGAETMTGGRLLRLAPLLGDETFMVTYGDGLADVDLGALVAFHRRHGRIATLTAVRPPVRSRRLAFDGARVTGFANGEASTWVNGGFFVFEPAVFDHLGGDGDVLEAGPLSRLAREGELMAFQHEGFWQCMDTAAERDLLEETWRGGCPPWLPTPGLAGAATIARPPRSMVRDLAFQEK